LDFRLRILFNPLAGEWLPALNQAFGLSQQSSTNLTKTKDSGRGHRPFLAPLAHRFEEDNPHGRRQI
jgi:hypothetical protein